MMTQVLPIADPEAQTLALTLLADQQIIAAPTDTVYGVMCHHHSPEAIERLYVAKGRPPHKAIPVLIGDSAQLPDLVRMPLPHGAEALVAAFWPGPLTLVLPAQTHLPTILTAGQPTLAVRMPAHPALCDLIRRSGPLAATSANRSGGPESHTAAEVEAQLGGHVPLILADADEARDRGPASTIVDLADPEGPRLLRPGPIAETVRATLAGVGLVLTAPA